MSFVRFNPQTQAVGIVASAINPLSYFSTYWLVQMLRHAQPYASGQLLDIGCASKPYQELFQAERHIGVDWLQTLHQHLRVDAFSDATALPFGAECFDTVLCTEVLEHLPRPHSALAEMARVAKPDAHLILSVPFLFRIHEAPHDYFRYTPYALETLLEQAGFSLLKIYPRGGRCSLLSDVLIRMLGGSVNRLLKALRLRGSALRVAQQLLIIAPQALWAAILLALYQHAPRWWRWLDPVNEYTLGYVAIARKKPCAAS